MVETARSGFAQALRRDKRAVRGAFGERALPKNCRGPMQFSINLLPRFAEVGEAGGAARLQFGDYGRGWTQLRVVQKL